MIYPAASCKQHGDPTSEVSGRASGRNTPANLHRTDPHVRGPGFTLIEMLVVIAIILLLAGVVVPAASSLWNERKMSDTVNTFQGLLMTTRVRAMQSEGGERGFFVYVDAQGDQRIVRIEQPEERLADPDWQNVFQISDARDEILAKPIRIAPLYAVEDESTGEPYTRFSLEELANSDFDEPPGEQAQRHRNFFTVVYSTDGHLIPDRDVLIQDADEDDDGVGDRTGLKVGPGPPNADYKTYKFYARDPSGSLGMEPLIDVSPFSDPPVTIPNLVIEPKNEEIALNFPSVSGLLVYDDELFNRVPTPEDKRGFLFGTAQPLYVSRYTGTVIRGPIGEAP